MKFIFNIIKKRHCTKDILKVLKLFSVALFIAMAIVMIKYNPIYKVYYNDEFIGYVKDKSKFDEEVKNRVLTSNSVNALFTELNSELTYSITVTDIGVTNEEEIIEKLANDTTTMYRVYAIKVNEEEKTYVNTMEEATSVVAEMQEQYSTLKDVNITLTEKFTNNMDEVGVVELAEAETAVDLKLREIKDEQTKIAQATCNGIYLSVKPVSGTITSRYGAVESVRDHAHGGLDIGAPAGTRINATAAGTVTYSGWMGGYGYLVIIDHGNEVQTYYGHCSKLYVSVGDIVEAGDRIAAVGSTGNSTGNHLHFEIRVNGKSVNPQNYIYR